MDNTNFSAITVRDFKKVVEFNLDNGIRRAILALGAPGIGKSQVVEQITKERGIGMVDLRLLYMQETDLKGVPFPDREKQTTKWLPNDLLPQVERDGEKGVLLVDEITSAPKRVQAAAYQLIQDYRLGEYKVPDGWLIVGAGNREDDDGVFVQMPSPLANRFQIHELRPDLEIWKADFAYKRGVNPKVIAYLNFKPEALHTQEPGENTMVFASPRSWEAVSDILNTGADAQDPFTRIQITGNIGDVETSSFISFLKYEDKLPSLEGIFSGKIKNPPEDRSLVYLLISSIVAKLSTVVGKEDLDEEEESKLRNVVPYICRMQPEFVALGLKDIISLNPKLMKRFLIQDFDDPAIVDFFTKNAYLL